LRYFPRAETKVTELRATYRLQFRNGMDFDRAAALVPYFAGLGISHLYASPIMEAVPGSTHGYDVADHGRFDESLGGLDGFVRMSDALKANGLGLILDIVPNHMAASVHNPWWRDVLRYGRNSRYADYFDIDWSAPRLTLPVLGRPYGEVLEAGELSAVYESDGWWLSYFDHRFPLDPATVADMSADAQPNLDAVHRLHEAQAYRLAYWRLARDGLSYRRFFEVADLVGVRVEDPAVFEDVHRLLFEQIEAERIQGLRIDHVDGLADPTGYFTLLQDHTPAGFPIWVEKILARGETLPATWDIAGESGYSFADQVNALLTNPAAENALAEGYDGFTGGPHDYEPMREEAKAEVLHRNLAAELETMAQSGLEALSADRSGRDWGPDSVRRSIAALLEALPVYRTYFNGSDAGERDRQVLDRAERSAKSRVTLDDSAPVSAVARLLYPGFDPSSAAEIRFRTRFQQTSGALMAKGVEDTLFYRYNRLLSANEVGGEPEHLGLRSGAFHQFMRLRATSTPLALSATATHDTKRGEDARTRIAAISELPQQWTEAVAAFDHSLGAQARQLDAETRWLAYQALLGAWEPEDPALGERFEAYLVKAAREAKLHTSWVGVNATYEKALSDFARAALSSDEFRHTFDTQTAPFILMGARKSLVQLALKLMLPGIPDIYQGTEQADFSFVDPDNRRAVPFESLAKGDAASPLAAAKSRLLRFCLELRRQKQHFFTGAYRPLSLPEPPDGNARYLGFARSDSGSELIVIVELAGGSGVRASLIPRAHTGTVTRLFDEPFDTPADAASSAAQSTPLWIGEATL
jgi:(1->4)-alpha-D-glucan 1-alpha-D-glucosylmutase